MFDLIDNQVKINPSTLAIPEFKAIWKRDKTKGKSDAYCELCYVYYMCDYKSEYRNYPPHEKEDKIKNDFTSKRLGEKWKPDSKVIDAMIKYKEMQETPSLRFLSSVQKSLDKLSDYLNSAEVDEDNLNAILSAIDKGSRIVPGLGKLKESVSKEVAETAHIRGGGDAGFMEK